MQACLCIHIMNTTKPSSFKDSLPRLLNHYSISSDAFIGYSLGIGKPANQILDGINMDFLVKVLGKP